MEDSPTETARATDCSRWYISVSLSLTIPALACSFPLPILRLFAFILVIPSMGRRPWATPDQRVYLKSFLPSLAQAKDTIGLNTLYTQVYEGFLKKWKAHPIVLKPGEVCPPELLLVREKTRLQNVRVHYLLPILMFTFLQRIVNWYKEERKKSKAASLPHSAPAAHILDLSGKSSRKKPPYQLHQAYSVRYWRPNDSPLWLEVEDLWARRNEDAVCEVLDPFLKMTKPASGTASQKLLFHMAVMRWKCSLLNSDGSMRTW